MRSWYVDRSDSHNYIKKPLEIYPSSVNLHTARKENTGTPQHMKPEPVKDGKSINRDNGKIQRANDVIRDANRAIHEANVADLAWMDSLADIDPLDFVAKK
jgi:hypothetical protein